MRHPDFLIGGAQKAGTTALHILLKKHPSVFFPERPQELDFFAHDALYQRGSTWYLRHFQNAGDRHLVLGQTSTAYLYVPEASLRICRDLPHIRLIFILRHPVDRAYSHYWHNVKYGIETEPFALALDQEQERISHGVVDALRYSYQDRGRYAGQLERFLELLPREQILVLTTERLASSPEQVVDRCCEFLGIRSNGHSLPQTDLHRRWNAARLPRSLKLQRWTARFRFDSSLGRRIALVLDRVNLRQTAYPPLAEDIRARLLLSFTNDRQRVEDLVGLELEEWAS